MAISLRIAAVPICKNLTGGRKLFMLPEFLRREGDIMLFTYGDFITTAAVIISLVRLVLEIIRYSDENKKK